MDKLNEKEQELFDSLDDLSDEEFLSWTRAPRTFDPQINVAKVTQAVMDRRL